MPDLDATLEDLEAWLSRRHNLLELADAEPDQVRRDAREARARAIRECIEEAWGGADRLSSDFGRI